MFRKLGVLGFALAAFTMLAPSVAEAAVVYHHYPHGYYYRHGHWTPYRGAGYPYRGGYYDRYGRWHRV
jgi:hypothetical protein